MEAANEVFPEADWQRCVVDWYRNVFSQVPNSKVAEVARMLKRSTPEKIAHRPRPRPKRSSRSCGQ